MLYIRQGATHKVVIGPVVAVANGYVPVTTLDLSTADEAEAILHDNATTVDIAGYTFAAITNADGYYMLTLHADISGTVGHVTIAINDDSLCLPVRQDFTVVEEAVYDQMFAASAPGAATVAALATVDGIVDDILVDTGTTLPATLSTIDSEIGVIDGIVDSILVDTATLGAPAGASHAADIAAIKVDTAAILVDTGTSGVLVSSGTGTGQVYLTSGLVRLSSTGVDDIWDEAYAGHVAAGSVGAALGGELALAGTVRTGGNYSTTVQLPTGAVNDDDYYNNMVIEVLSGTGVGQSEFISDYVGSTALATINGTFATTLDATSVVQVRKFGTLPGASAPTAGQVADAVWDEAMTAHVAEGSFGTMLQAFHVGTAQAGTSDSITLDATGSSATTAVASGAGVTDHGGQTFQTREEELHAHKRPVEAGEVRVRKEVHTE
jgi:hypothetical protein